VRLLDSNIIIYSALPEYSFLRDLFYKNDVFASLVSKVEVLGYHKITDDQFHYFSEIFSILPLLPVDTAVIDQAIHLRRLNKISLGDSLIAATAIVNGCSIITRNDRDFADIRDISCENPIDKRSSASQ
jgi:predicted nucleic acid-binding protein